MSTNGTIAYREPDGESWTGTYNHWDSDTLQPRIQAAIDRLGLRTVRSIIARHPHGFSFFDPAGTESMLGSKPMHEVLKDGSDELQHGKGNHGGGYEWTYIIELDGSITVLEGWQ